MHKDRGEKAMNSRIIKIAHVVAVILILLVAAVVMGVARQG